MLSIRLVAVAAVGLPLVGCYTLRPTRGAVPELGAAVAFDVNDAGRLALGGSMGPEIAQIEGRLLDRANGEYVVAVSGVRMLRGGSQSWSGEKVRIKSEHVASTYERRLSRGRTIALSAVGIGVVGFFVTRSILGSGDTDGPRLPGDTASTQLIPRP